ncbi:MAG: repair protein RecO [Bacteroidota bacterium]|jgi:DNA repair protein RecO (recombination protein O)
MLHPTKGIVLRNVKYGDTSMVVTIYTEAFGVQSYLVNGVRSANKSTVKSNIYQASMLLDLIVYHSPHKNLQRIKEARVNYVSQHLQTQISRQAVATYITELIGKTVSEPESHPELFAWFESCFHYIDIADESSLANFPICFTLEQASRLGFGMQEKYSTETPYFDMQNGVFCTQAELSSLQYIEGDKARYLYELSLPETSSIPLHHELRSELLSCCIQYLRLHIPHLPELKSIGVLQAVFS